MDKKRIILITLFIIATGLIGYALYRVFFYKEKPPITSTKPTNEGQVGVFPKAGEGQKTTTPAEKEKLPVSESTQQTAPGQIPTEQITPIPTKKVIDSTIISPTSDTVGSAKFYNQQDGKFYRLTKDGSIELISDKVFYNVQKVTWSPKNEETIMEYPDGSNIYYNFQTRKQVSLPKHWEEFSFASTGDKVAAKSMGYSPENKWLITADPQGNSINLIEKMGNNADKVKVDWSPNKQIVATTLTGQALGADRQELLFVGLHGENFKSTIVEGRDLRSKWSPDGQKLLYSVYNSQNQFKPQIWVVNAEGDSIGTGRKMLELNTWADKCSFKDARTLFCGVPKELPVGAGFAPKIADSVPDSLFQIDIYTGIKKEIQLGETHTIENIFLSGDGKKVFFTDKNQNGLFSVDL